MRRWTAALPVARPARPASLRSVGITRKSERAAGIVNASGQPEIELTIDGLVLSATPPAKPEPTTRQKPEPNDADES